ncbi:hypothetical protein ACFSX9_09720 [Flavobacterium ardleyense]|uniref:Uncharacterized protein n=1 Tax=Flavobacterium ardleyense TaxID=2038737 RepID=A0ABW5Z810_9FLAO
MKKTQIFLTLIIICLSGQSFGQEKDSLEFENFKEFLPYIIKGIQDENQSDNNITERTSGIFEKTLVIKENRP